MVRKATKTVLFFLPGDDEDAEEEEEEENIRRFLREALDAKFDVDAETFLFLLATQEGGGEDEGEDEESGEESDEEEEEEGGRRRRRRRRCRRRNLSSVKRAITEALSSRVRFRRVRYCSFDDMCSQIVNGKVTFDACILSAADGVHKKVMQNGAADKKVVGNFSRKVSQIRENHAVLAAMTTTSPPEPLLAVLKFLVVAKAVLFSDAHLPFPGTNDTAAADADLFGMTDAQVASAKLLQLQLFY